MSKRRKSKVSLASDTVPPEVAESSRRWRWRHEDWKQRVEDKLCMCEHPQILAYLIPGECECRMADKHHTHCSICGGVCDGLQEPDDYEEKEPTPFL